MLKNVKFEISVFDKKNILNTNKNEIVLVGKSNVGKSSFINSLANQKKLAYVGQTPGKTRSINYYNVDNNFFIVDLPGYGFSKMSIYEKEKVNNLIDEYINSSNNIKHIFFLVDIRHTPSKDDKLMYDWLISTNIPFTIIANKSDKIAKTKTNDYIKVIKEYFNTENAIIAFSAETKINLEQIEKIINENIYE